MRKQYGGFTAVEGSQFSVAEGEVFGIIGPNGAGKTTTLKMLAGLVELTSGTARVAGYDASDPAMRTKLGFLPEESPLYEDMTPISYLTFFADLYDVPRDTAQERIHETLDRLDLQHCDRRLGDMSKGMRRKVAIARSLVNDPDVLVYDEPASGLDPLTTNYIIEFTRELSEAGKTIVFSAHNLFHVESICDRLVVMNDGRIVARGSVEDIRRARPDHVPRVHVRPSRGRSRGERHLPERRREHGRRRRDAGTHGDGGRRSRRHSDADAQPRRHLPRPGVRVAGGGGSTVKPRKTFRIARWEVSKNDEQLDRRTLAAVGVVLVLVAALTPMVASRRITLDDGIYRVGVAEDSPYHDPVAADPTFVVVEPTTRTLESGAFELFVCRDDVRGCSGDGILWTDIPKGRAALAELRTSVERYNDRQMAAEPDRAAAFPVNVTLRYVEQDALPSANTGTSDSRSPITRTTADGEMRLGGGAEGDGSGTTAGTGDDGSR